MYSDSVRILVEMKPQIRDIVSYRADSIPCHLLVIHTGAALHFSRQKTEIGSYKGFAGNVCIRVTFKMRIKHSVRDLVTDLVGVPI